MSTKDLAEAVRIGLLAIEKNGLTSDQFAQALNQWNDPKYEQSFYDFLISTGLVDGQERLERVPSLPTMAYAKSHESEATEIYAEVETTDLANRENMGAGEFAPTHSEAERFQIVKQHARGGLGIVFVAKDAQLNRDVALKQIRSDMKMQAASKSRFLVEAEITGQLEHPGIVPVYALGIDKSGNAFYAMRFVRGTELKSCIQEFHSAIIQARHPFDGVELRQLLRRFMDICNAMEYAHSRGILHRDLKPANVMLGSHGETLVVDWGLANLLSQSQCHADQQESLSSTETRIRVRSGSASLETPYGTFSGTVPYASPEQIQGLTDQFCAASDVYSLGAILYEILTNQPPIAKRPDSLKQVIDWIRDEKVPRAEQVVASVPRALSRICQKAMRFKLTDRYQSARELALDVDRWLADERVVAFGNEEPVVETLGRWMRRYRSWTVPVALALLITMIVAVIGSWLINQARVRELAAKQVAIEYKNEAVERIGVARNAIDTMLVGSSEVLSDFPMTRDLQRRLLEVAMEDYAKLSRSSSNDERLELERIRAKVRVADIRHMQSDFDGAEKYYDSAIDELESHARIRLGKDGVDDMLWQIELGKTIGRKGLAYDLEGRFVESKTQFANAIDRLKSVARQHEESDVANWALARQSIIFANSTGNASDPATSIGIIEEAIARLERFDTTKDKSIHLMTIRAKESLARAYGRVGRTNDAVESLGRAIAEIRNRSLEALMDRDGETALASIYVSRANLERTVGAYEQAMADMVAAKEIYDGLKSEWPDNLEFIENLALTEIDIAVLQFDLQKPGLALENIYAARDQYRKLHDEYPKIVRFGDGLATALSVAGLCDLYTNPNIEEAFESLAQSLRIFEQLANETRDPIMIGKAASLHGQLGQAFHRERDREGARKQYNESRNLFQTIKEIASTLPANEYALSEVEWRNGWLEWDAELLEPASVLHAQAIERLRSLSNSHVDNAQYQERLASYLIQCPDKSLQGFDEAHVLLQLSIEKQPQNLRFLNTMSECKAAKGQFDDAEQIVQKVVELRESWTSRDYGVLAIIQKGRGQLDAAKQSIQEARNCQKADQTFDLDLGRWIDSIQKTIDGK